MIEGISNKILKTDDWAKRSLWFPKFLLRVVFMWPDEGNRFLKRFIFWLIMLISVFMEYGMINFVMANFTDFNESFTAISFFSTTFQVLVKVSILYYNLDTVRNITQIILNDFWPSNLLGNVVEESLKRNYKILLTGMMFIYLNAFFFSIVFLITPLFKSGRETPYKIMFPFDYSTSPKFECMYIVHCITNFYIVLYAVIGVDTLFMALCSNITAQYRLLKNVFLKLGTEEMKNLNEKLGSLNANKRSFNSSISEEKKFLIRCFNHHQLLLRTSTDVEKVFSLIGFFQLGFSITALCLSSFVLTRESVEFNQLINIGIYMSGNLVQIFCYCSVAHEVDFEMNNLPQAIFSSLWYRTDFYELKHDLIFSIKKSQEVRKLTALKLFPLNYATFIEILRISFSFYTLLSSIAVTSTNDENA